MDKCTAHALTLTNFVLAIILLCAAFMTLRASPGNLDQTFGGNGRVLTDFASFDDVAGAVAVQPDGKIVVGGFAYTSTLFSYNYAIARYNPDGTLDSTFGDGGKVVTGFSVLDDFCLSVNLQSDGKIVAVGYLSGGGAAIGIARYNPNGTLDTSFNGNGKLEVYFNSGTFRAKGYASVIQNDGKIVVAGSVRNGSDYDFALVRVNSNGTLDSTFGTGGKVTTAFGTLTDEARAVTLLPGGQILAVGYRNNGANFDLAAARYNSDGSLDTSFGSEGKSSVPVGSGNDYGYAVAALSNGSFLVAGESNTGSGYDALLAKFTSNGQLDTTFGSNGIRLTAFSPTGDDGANGLAIQRNGKIIIAGYTGTAPNRNFALARFDQNGTPDQSFNGSGRVVSDFGNSDDGIGSIALQQDGQIVVCGFRVAQSSTPTSDFIVARYQGDAVPRRAVMDFDGDGKTDVGIFRPIGATGGEWWVSKSSDSSVLSAGFGSSTDIPTPADFTGDGKTDIAFFRPSTGTWYILRSEDSLFYGFPFGSSTDVPAPADYDGDGKADAAVFRNGAWYILRTSDGGVTSAQFGIAGDKPVPADFDGDGKADIAIYRPNGTTGGEWWVLKSSGGIYSASFGSATDKATVGDYTGDGKADCAFFSPSNSTWYILRSEDGLFYGFPFGNSTDTPAPGDYDGDGRTDAAVFRQPNEWYVNKTTGGVMSATWGSAGDRPVPGSYVR